LIWQCTLLLRFASLLVPKTHRKEWYQRWYSEVWHWAHFLVESRRLSAGSKLELMGHVWGAFPNAVWRRFDQERVLHSTRETLRSPSFCLGSIFSLLVVAVVLTGFAPTIRRGFTPLPYYQPDRIAVLSFPDHYAYYPDAGLFGAVNRWSRESRTATAMAAYSLRVSTVVPVEDRFPFPGVLAIEVRFATRSARVSPNFFEMLGVKAAAGRVFRRGDEAECPDCLVLTDKVWRERFHRDPSIIGRKLIFSGAESTVIGVLPENFSFLTPETSVWALPLGAGDLTDIGDHIGAVLRLAPGISVAQAEQELRTRSYEDRSVLNHERPEVSMMVSRGRQAAKIYLFFAFLALLVGLALAGSRLAAARAQRIKLSARGLTRWWAFLLAKILLLLVTCFVFALEACGRVSILLTGTIQPLVGPFSTWLFLVSAMAAFSWCLYDQTRRCRVCLKRLGNEASVGTASYLLLDWWGTELVCSDGHGLLHLPEMKSSWLEVEQWVRLDESWKPLFEDDKTIGPARAH
jgi:hypothetical protein